MSDQRGLSLLELLIAAALATVVAGALFSAYVATARSFGESGAQAALQRQGALVLEEIGRHVRDAGGKTPLAIGSCNGVAGSLLVSTAAGDSVCFYARADGALCEARGTACRNLLAGGLKKIVLLPQPVTPDLRCPVGADGNPMPAGARCFRTALVASDAGPPMRVDLAFAIRDGDLAVDLDGVNTMAFSISLTCSGRNC